jgi:hypothetical protein
MYDFDIFKPYFQQVDKVMEKGKFTTRPESRPHNTGLAKVAVNCSADTFVVNQSLVLRINPYSYRDGENRHLCHAPKR